MSEKWEATLDGSIYSQPSGAPDDGGDLVASGLDAHTAQQIVRAVNAHDALVEALRRVLSLGITHHTEKEARAALALAEEK